MRRVTLVSIIALGLVVGGCGLTGGDNSGRASLEPGASSSNPGVVAMHRLNTAEYNATVTDTLGTTLQPATANWRGGEIDGFDNIASVLGVDDAQYALYSSAAESIAKDVFASATLRAKVVTCSRTDDMACVKAIIGNTGLRLFRRPLLAAELTTYAKVYSASRALGADHDGSLENVLWSLLSSAEFLYRMEFDDGVETRHLIRGYELASRLSYFLWSSGPDDALLAAAPRLDTDVAIDSQVSRMLTDPKSARLVQNFAGQWLGARKVLAHPVAADIYPSWSPDIAAAASREIYAYFDEFMRTDRPWTDFPSADLNFVDAGLASFYGIPNVTSSSTTRVAYASDDRAGFLGLVGFLAVSSLDRRSSPTLRGKWLLVNLLCSPPPAPPPGVPALEMAGSTDVSDVRALLEAHRNSPACSACHSLMDPFGLALEQYDGIGKIRTSYPDGSNIDVATSLPPSDAYPNGIEFTGLAGAEAAIAQNPRFKTCITEKLYTYGLGRSLTADDKTNTAAIEKDWEGSGALTLNRLVHRLALAEPFRYRNPGGSL